MAHVVVERQRESDPVALGLRPCDLLRDDAERILAVLAHEQRRRVIVGRQRADAVEDLVEEILRMDLLHDLAIDPVANFEHPLSIQDVNRLRHGGRDPGEEPPVVASEFRLGPHQAQSRPGGAAPSNRRHHQVAPGRRVRMADEPADVLEIPGRVFRDRQEQPGRRFAGLGQSDAAPVRLEELATVPQGVRQRLARLADRSEVVGKAVEELEELEFPRWGQH
jgi:hypothetical protein